MSIGLLAQQAQAPLGVMLFPGILSILDWNFTLTHGVRPNVANITIAPQASIPTLDGTLTILYGTTIVANFINCRIDAASIERNTQNMIVRLAIMDRRWRWQTAIISGSWNTWKDNTDLGNAMGVNTRPELVAGSTASPRWLMQQCLQQLGELPGSYDLSQVPNDSWPTTEWDCTPAVEAFTQVSDYVGCRIIMRADALNTISVEPEGEGAALPNTLDIQYTNPTIDPPEVPSGIACVCGPVRYNFDFELEPVGLDKDGTIKTLAKLSYAPNAGSSDGIGGFGAVDLATMNQITDLTLRSRALSCVLKWYRIKSIKGLGPQMPELPATFNRLYYLPLLDTQIFAITETTDEGVITREKPAQVYGIYYAASTGKNVHHNNVQTKLRPIRIIPGFGDPTDPYTKAVLYNNGFDLDVRRGIVKFGEPVFRWSLADEKNGEYMQMATLVLRTSCYFTAPATRSRARYRRNRRLTLGNPTVPPCVLLHDELQLKRYPVYNGGANPGGGGGGAGIPAQNAGYFTVGSMTDNRAELDPNCDYYIDQQQLKYQIDYSQTVGYATLRNVPLDGAIREITWQGGPQGATTRVSRNNETNPHVMNYNERRLALTTRAAAARNGRILRAQNQALQGGQQNDALIQPTAVASGGAPQQRAPVPGTPSSPGSGAPQIIPLGDSIG